MATNLYYNGIELRNVLTKQFDQEPVQDPSGTDIWYWKYTISVSSMLYKMPDETGGVVIEHGAKFGSSIDVPEKSLAQLQEQLMVKRAQFHFDINGEVVIKAVGSSSYTKPNPDNPIPGEKIKYEVQDIDANNGPNPIRCSVKQISKSAFRIEFTIEVYLSCKSNNPDLVVNNRWSVADDYDQNGKTTRTWEGRLRLRHVLKAEQMAHTFRNLCLPPLVKGFRRKAVKFFGELNGLELVYTITDAQLHKMGTYAPFPATKLFGTHTESITVDSSNSLGEVSVTVEGLLDAPKSRLIEIGLNFIEQKLQIKKGEGRKHLLLSMSIVDYVDDENNRITVTSRVRHLLDKNIKRVAGILVATIGQAVNIDELTKDKDPVGNFNPAASAGLKLAKAMYCHLQSPCDKGSHDFDRSSSSDSTVSQFNEDYEGTENPTTDIDGPGKDKPSDTEEDPRPEATYQEADLNKREHGSETIASNSTSWYEFRMDNVTETNTGLVALPIAENPSRNPTIALVRLHAPTAKRTLRMSASRINAWPSMPGLNTTTVDGITFIALKSKVLAKNAKRMASTDDFLYMIDCETVYAMSKTHKDANSMTQPVNPLEKEDPNLLKTIPMSAFKDYMNESNFTNDNADEAIPK